uniref:Uncharacterized protein n=1 Tax=Picea sitchensis TaxID=3332 RepID=A9NZX1_PICSI|nr:unknown [Picea sitchensis]
MATFTHPIVSTQAASFPSTFLLPSSSSFRSSSPRICRIVKKNNCKNIYCRSDSRSPSPEESNSNSNNILLKLAWYGSEALGIAASVFRPSTAVQPSGEQSSQNEVAGSIPKDAVVDAIKKDFERSYFVTGNLTTIIYEEDCEFADPAGSFRGLKRFKRNCSNFGSLLEKSNMKLMDWEDFEDRGIGHWRFICVLAFPWRPILSATGYTEYYYDAQSGKICRHVEHWNVPKMVLLKQIFKPNPGLWRK